MLLEKSRFDSYPLRRVRINYNKFIHPEKYPEYQTLEVQVCAIRDYPSNIMYIKNPSEDIIHETIIRRPSCIEYIKEPSVYIQFLVVQRSVNFLNRIKKQDHSVIWYTLFLDPEYIAFVRNPTEKMLRYAFSTKSRALEKFSWYFNSVNANIPEWIKLISLEYCWEEQFYNLINKNEPTSEWFHKEVNRMKVLYGPMGQNDIDF